MAAMCTMAIALRATMEGTRVISQTYVGSTLCTSHSTARLTLPPRGIDCCCFCCDRVMVQSATSSSALHMESTRFVRVTFRATKAQAPPEPLRWCFGPSRTLAHSMLKSLHSNRSASSEVKASWMLHLLRFHKSVTATTYRCCMSLASGGDNCCCLLLLFVVVVVVAVVIEQPNNKHIIYNY
jgi:hypothetical protein